MRPSFPLLLRKVPTRTKVGGREKALSVNISVASVELAYSPMDSLHSHINFYNKKVTIPKFQIGMQRGSLEQVHEDLPFHTMEIVITLKGVSILFRSAAGVIDENIHSYFKEGRVRLWEGGTTHELLTVGGEQNEKLLLNLHK